MLQIASYNIHRCIGTDLRSDVQRIAAVINELGCDTIGLQEVSSRPGPGVDSRQLDFLAQATGMTALAGQTIVKHGGDYGTALLTRRRILDFKRHDLSYRRFEPRGALEVELEVDGESVSVIVTHLGLRMAERRYQVRKLLAVLRSLPMQRSVVVLGDINEWLPLSRPLRWLHELMGKPPSQRSFPVWLPLFALDRVWVRPSGSLYGFSVHRSELARHASDHFPVKAQVSGHALPLREILRSQ